MENHDVTNIFPMMSAEEFALLKNDIEANGQLEPILIFEHKIVDGRNRYKACMELGLKPKVKPWDGTGSLTELIVSLNLKRRHLDASQKAVVALEIEKRLAKEAKERQRESGRRAAARKKGINVPKVEHSTPGRAIEQAAAAVGVSKGYVADAKNLTPNLQKKVFNGEMKIPTAKREMKERKNAEIRKQATSKIKSINNKIIVGDFYANADKTPDNSISIIFTDPPYSKDAEKMLPQLADFAARKLAPGGSLLFYIGHLQLPAAFDAFKGKLKHWWTCACFYGKGGEGQALMSYSGVRVGWKPMLWFVKDTRVDTHNIVIDTMYAQKEKKFHDWQQPEADAGYWIDKLCPADGIVCDPFLGGGTTAAAAQKLKRKWIGFEIDKETARVATARLEGK